MKIPGINAPCPDCGWQPPPPDAKIGKTDYPIASGNEGDISVWGGDVGQQVDSCENVEAMALSDLDGNKFVYLALGEVRDDAGGLIYKGWLASAWEA